MIIVNQQPPRSGVRQRAGRFQPHGPRSIAVLLAILLAGGCATAESPEPNDSPSVAAHTDAQGGGQDESDNDQGPSDLDQDAPDSSPTPAGPTTSGDAPEGGTIHVEVAVEEQEYLPAADLQTETEIGDVATVEIVDIARTDVEARTAGEISGPGVVVTVLLTNDSGEELDLAMVTVNAEDTTALPLNPMTGSPADPFFGPLAGGSSAEATYVFGLPDDASTPLTVTVNPAPDAAVGVFIGDPS